MSAAKGQTMLILAGAIYASRGDSPRTMMLVRDGIVVAFDAEARALSASAEVFDFGDRTVLPGFCDSHIHLFSLIERAAGVDCREARSIDEMVQLLIRPEPGESWVRAAGYDHERFVDGRHPDRFDLDRAWQHRPVRVMHRTGHLAIVNSAGLRLIPPAVLERGHAGGFVEYSAEDGQPNGRLWEPGAWFSRGVLPPLSEAEITDGARSVSAGLLGLGITAIHEAGQRNNEAQWETYRGLVSRGDLDLGVLMMTSPDALIPKGNEELGAAKPPLKLGPVKLVLADDPDDLPSIEEFAGQITTAAKLGRGVAIHAVIAEAVAIAVEAAARTGIPGVRVEHAAEWPDRLFEIGRRAGIRVVTHPGWVRERGRRYLHAVEADRIGWIHRGRSFLDAKIGMWFGSDAPASEPDPFGSIETAVTRRAADGSFLNESEAMALKDAIRASIGGRAALDPGAPGGALVPGARADFILVDQDPFSVSPGAISDCRVVATFVGGREAWRRGRP